MCSSDLLDEVQDEPTGEDSMSDAIMAEWVEEPVAREAPPPQRSERLRNSREILLLDNDTREILLLDNDEPTTYAEAMMDQTLRNGKVPWDPK